MPRFPLTYPTSLWRPVSAIADRKATAMSAGTECSSGIHATAVSASCSLKGRPVSAEQRPAATNPVSGRGLGGQPGGSNTTDLAENEFGLLAAIVSLLREFGAARLQSVVFSAGSDVGRNRAPRRADRDANRFCCVPSARSASRIGRRVDGVAVWDSFFHLDCSPTFVGTVAFRSQRRPPVQSTIRTSRFLGHPYLPR